MKTLTIRLPASLATQIEAEARARKVSKAAIVRERLGAGDGASGDAPVPPEAIADLIDSVDGLPPDLSARRKKHLEAIGYGRKRPR